MQTLINVLTLEFAGLASAIVLLVWGTTYKTLEWIRSPIRKHRRADAGKVRCQERSEKCKEKATFHTPAGYFCDWHSYDHEAVLLRLGGRVRFKNKLTHAKQGVKK